MSKIDLRFAAPAALGLALLAACSGEKPAPVGNTTDVVATENVAIDDAMVGAIGSSAPLPGEVDGNAAIANDSDEAER